MTNRINLEELGEFWKTWPLVNVRYRKDSDEQRFIYANEIAWKALQDGVIVYPENAMFAKVAFRVREDSAFPASLQPVGFIRVQLMRKSNHDYSESNGWGYALYVPGAQEGRQNVAIDDVKDQRVCHGCHTLVKDRDFVFSRPAFFETPELDRQSFAVDFRARFETKHFNELPSYARSVVQATLGDRQDSVKYYSMPLFLGALHESAGPMVDFSVRDGTAYLLADEQRKQFLIAVPSTPKPGCRSVAYTLMPVFDPQRKHWRLLRDEYCDGKGQIHELEPMPPELLR